MKRFNALLIAILMVLSLASCTSSSPGPSSAAPNTAAPEASAPSSGDDSNSSSYSIDKVTVFATFAVGGGVDVFGRTMTKMLQDTGLWDGSFVYENVGGASGQVGMTQICEQHGGDDSYLIPTSDNVLMSGYINKIENSYGYNEVSEVCRLYCEYRVYVTAPSTGITSFDDLIEKAKTSDVVASTSGIGGASHIALAGLSHELGVDFRCVPYGDDEDVVATLSGEADIGAMGSKEAITYIRSGDLIPLAVAAPERLDMDVLADVPTCKELGYDCEFGTSRGWVLPPEVDEAAVEYWAEIFKQLSETEEFLSYVHDAGGTVAYLGPEDFHAANEEQYNSTCEILDRVGFYD